MEHKTTKASLRVKPCGQKRDERTEDKMEGYTVMTEHRASQSLEEAVAYMFIKFFTTF